MKICKICGEMFEPESNAQCYCKRDHYVECPVCHQPMIWNSLRPVRPCSKECSNKQRAITLMNNYDVTNSGQIHHSRSKHEYDNLKYIQSIDRRLTRIPENSIEPVTECRALNCSMKVIDYDDQRSYMCFLKNSVAKKFLNEYGVNKFYRFGHKGISIGLVSENNVYEVIRIQLSKIKNYDYELVNYGSILKNPDYNRLLSYIVNLYDLHTILAQVEQYDNINKDMQSMNFTYRFTRPARLLQNCNSILPAREVYTFEH